MHAEATAPGTELLDTLDDALVTVRRASQSLEYRRRLLEGIDIPGGTGTLRVLRAVERSTRDAPSIGEVAASLGLDPSTTSRMVERCVADGLVSREPHPGDRRRSHLKLTDRGRDVLAAATRNRRTLLSEVTADWEHGDLSGLVGLLRTLNEGFDRVIEQ